MWLPTWTMPEPTGTGAADPCVSAAAAATYMLLVGAGGAVSIDMLRFDGKSLTPFGNVTVPTGPTWLEAGPANGTFYTLGDDKSVSSLRLTSSGAELTGQATTQGEGGVHIHYNNSGITVAHYGSGSVSYIPIGTDGSISNSTAPQYMQLPFAYASTPGPLPEREDQSRAHGTTSTSDGQWWVADLGSDSVWSFTASGDGMKLADEYKVPGGFGPRHLTSPDGVNVYVVGEMSNSVVKLDKPGQVNEAGCSILPPSVPTDYGSLMGGGEIMSHPTTPSTIYASNRNQVKIKATHADYEAPPGDSVAILKIAKAGAPPAVNTFVSTKCDHIRAMKVSPCGMFVAVAGMNNAKIEVYAISGTDMDKWTLVATHDGIKDVMDILFLAA